MPTEAEPLLALEYLRVSIKKDASLDQQHEDNLLAVEAHGWKLGEPYCDNDRSASRYATKAREGYDRLVADLTNATFDADVLILWESSRGSRRVGEWVLLIELCEERGILIFVTTHGRVYDPSNPRDRRTLLEDAVDSEYESSKMSTRLKRSAAARAAAGRPHGGRVPFGYERTYDPGTGKLTGQTIREDEAKVIRELYERVRKGHSLRSITRDFEARGVRTRTGKSMSMQYLRWFLLRPLYAGLRQHNGELYAAEWPGIVDKTTYYAVQRIMSDPARKTRRPGRANHLLSMIAVCAVCAGPLAARLGKIAGNTNVRRKQYVCHRKSCIKVDYDELDDLAEGVILGYLSRPDNVERLTATDQADDAELQQVRVQLAELRAELDALADDDSLPGDYVNRRAARLGGRIKDAESREVELSTPSVLRGLITPGKDVARRWKDATMSTKREVARILLAPDILGELRVTRTPVRGQRVPAHDRVMWRTSP